MHARGLAAPDAVALLRWILGTRVQIGPPMRDARVEVELRGHTARALAAELAGMGGALEIVEPDDVRDELASIGAALTARYRPRRSSPTSKLRA